MWSLRFSLLQPVLYESAHIEAVLVEGALVEGVPVSRWLILTSVDRTSDIRAHCPGLFRAGGANVFALGRLRFCLGRVSLGFASAVLVWASGSAV